MPALATFRVDAVPLPLGTVAVHQAGPLEVKPLVGSVCFVAHRPTRSTNVGRVELTQNAAEGHELGAPAATCAATRSPPSASRDGGSPRAGLADSTATADHRMVTLHTSADEPARMQGEAARRRSPAL